MKSKESCWWWLTHTNQVIEGQGEQQAKRASAGRQAGCQNLSRCTNIVEGRKRHTVTSEPRIAETEYAQSKYCSRKTKQVGQDVNVDGDLQQTRSPPIVRIAFGRGTMAQFPLTIIQVSYIQALSVVLEYCEKFVKLISPSGGIRLCSLPACRVWRLFLRGSSFCHSKRNIAFWSNLFQIPIYTGLLQSKRGAQSHSLEPELWRCDPPTDC